MATVLDKIVAAKWEEIARHRAELPAAELEAQVADLPPCRDFLAAVSRPGAVRLIAEVKKASPSKGVIREDFDPVAIARIYEQHGASAISVLTDEPFFQGCLDYLRRIRAAVDLPLLRKDFILDRYQLLQARAAGADAALLIAECLPGERIKELVADAESLGLTTLVELYDDENLPRVLASGTKLVGVNNRDLRTFHVDLGHTLRLREQIPREFALVGESGIRTHDDVQRLAAGGVQAILVGESLMSRPDIGRAVDELLNR
ncbi:MAG TPA: indole-3-glycerol phosphate synthase TrpC [Pirellulales bacterium]